MQNQVVKYTPVEKLLDGAKPRQDCTPSETIHRIGVEARRWLAQTWDKVENLGILRMVRDVFHLSGLVYFRSDGSIERIMLHKADPFASGLYAGLLTLLTSLHVAVNLDEI